MSIHINFEQTTGHLTRQVYTTNDLVYPFCVSATLQIQRSRVLTYYHGACHGDGKHKVRRSIQGTAQPNDKINLPPSCYPTLHSCPDRCPCPCPCPGPSLHRKQIKQSQMVHTCEYMKLHLQVHSVLDDHIHCTTVPLYHAFHPIRGRFRLSDSPPFDVPHRPSPARSVRRQAHLVMVRERHTAICMR